MAQLGGAEGRDRCATQGPALKGHTHIWRGHRVLRRTTIQIQSGRGVTQLMGRPQMSHLVAELLAEGPEFQHGAPEGPGREPRGHAGPQAPRRRHRPPAQHRVRVAGEALQQQQQPVPTGKHGLELALPAGPGLAPSHHQAKPRGCRRVGLVLPGVDHLMQQPLPRNCD